VTGSAPIELPATHARRFAQFAGLLRPFVSQPGGSPGRMRWAPVRPGGAAPSLDETTPGVHHNSMGQSASGSNSQPLGGRIGQPRVECLFGGASGSSRAPGKPIRAAWWHDPRGAPTRLASDCLRWSPCGTISTAPVARKAGIRVVNVAADHLGDLNGSPPSTFGVVEGRSFLRMVALRAGTRLGGRLGGLGMTSPAARLGPGRVVSIPTRGRWKAEATARVRRAPRGARMETCEQALRSFRPAGRRSRRCGHMRIWGTPRRLPCWRAVCSGVRWSLSATILRSGRHRGEAQGSAVHIPGDTTTDESWSSSDGGRAFPSTFN